MWEIIAANRRRSVILVSVMGMLMVGAGMLICEVIAPGAFLIGGIFALLLWALMSLVSYYSGDSIFLAAVGAKEIKRADHPTLFNIVEEMSIASGSSKMPRIFIVDDPRPNAFATGRDPEHASVAVTAGLLNRLNRDEVQGVIAHELAHIQNRDILYVMLAAVMIGVIALLADVFLRYIWFIDGRHRSSRGRGGGQAQFILLIIVILFMILGPISAQLLYFALSRRREYLADACAAQYTRYPEGLASALQKIARDPGMSEQRNRAMVPMYIVNPLKSEAAGLTSTHPPTHDRIKILRSMGGASLADYEAAYERAKGGEKVVPSGMLNTSQPVGVRPPWRDQEPEKRAPEPDEVERTRETGDMLWKLGRYVFVNCACGVKLKVPPGFKSPKVRCPKCQRMHDVPRA